MVTARDARPCEIRLDERPFQILAGVGDRGESVRLSPGSQARPTALLSRTAVREPLRHRR